MKQTPSQIYHEQCSWYKRYPRKLYKNMFRSVVTMAKVILVFMNIWVLAVVLVVSLGHWRVFESTGPKMDYDNSHLIVMRELLKEEASPAVNLSKPAPIISEPQELVPQVVQKPSTTTKPEPPPPNPALQRVKNLQNLCRQQHPDQVDLKQIPVSKLGSILVDEKNKFLYCQIPSVGNNDLRKLVLILSGAVNTTDPKTITGGEVYSKYGKSVKRLSEYSDPQKRSKMLHDYYKVIFVREPLERLLTTYKSKIVPKSSTYFHKTYGTQIIKKFRVKPSEKDLQTGSNVKFSEFAQYIIESDYDAVPANEHWRQFYKQCHPCLVNYDYVGKFETLLQDTNAILDKLHVKSKIKTPLGFDTKTIPESELRKQYGSIPAKTLNKLFKVYSIDYMLFGYKCPKYLHDLMEKEHITHDY